MDINELLKTTEDEVVTKMNGTALKAYDIVVKNQQNGQKTTCLVYPTNTIEQVFMANIDEVGLNKDSKEVFFINERTNQSTSKKDITMEEFELRENDTLAILTDGKVAVM